MILWSYRQHHLPGLQAYLKHKNINNKPSLWQVNLVEEVDASVEEDGKQDFLNKDAADNPTNLVSFKVVPPPKQLVQ